MRLPLALAAAILALVPAACDQAPGEDAFGTLELGTPPALRHVMFEVDALNRTIEPILRAPNQTPVVASAARSMQSWAMDPAWQAYYDEPAFLGDRALFEAYLGWLRAGVEQLATSAEASDVDGMRAGFIRTQQSCVACHKRFQPNI
ncbi:MAG: cytochrome c [Planctomycetota bacterium]|nr:cytochrome c [Planctomycetota bacterium]